MYYYEQFKLQIPLVGYFFVFAYPLYLILALFSTSNY